MLNITNKFDSGKNYQLNRAQLKSINFDGENLNKEEKPKEKRRDIYMEMPIRAFGYTNEIGEALRPVIGPWAWATWVPAIAYIGSDVADKYAQDEYGNQVPSGERAAKQLSTQVLASVLLPTVAVKTGQNTVGMLSSLAKSGLSFNSRERISEFVLNAMDRGEHKNFLDDAGKVSKKAFAESLTPKMAEKLKHKETKKMILKPLYAIKNWLAEPYLKNPKKADVNSGITRTVDRLVENRQNLLDGIKPEKMSEKMFKKFTSDSARASHAARKIAMSAGQNADEVAAAMKSAKQSVAFDYIKKLEKSHNFKNKALLSAGGFIALALLAKPIDRFVENVVMKKAVEPTIEYVRNKTNRDNSNPKA